MPRPKKSVFRRIPEQIYDELKGMGKQIIYGVRKGYWDAPDAPPTVRSGDVNFATLVRGEKEEDVGSFVPDLFNLANTPKGDLSCQIEERKWKANKKNKNKSLKQDKPELWAQLYRPNGKRKTPFELAMVATPSEDVDMAIDLVTQHVEKECRYRRDHGHLPWPVEVSKFRIKPDYLKYIEEVGLKVKGVYVAKVNYHNPIAKLSTRDIVLQYGGQWMSLFLTLSASAGLLLSGIASPWILGLAMVAMFLGRKHGNDFGMFDLAEGINRTLGWLLYLPWKSKDGYRFNFVNSVKTLAKLAALGVVLYFGVPAVFAGILALPWTGLSTLLGGLGMAGAVEAAQIGFAALFASVAAVSTIIGTLGGYRFFINTSFVYNQVDVSKEEAKALPTFKASNKAKKANLAELKAQLKDILGSKGKGEKIDQPHFNSVLKAYLKAKEAVPPCCANDEKPAKKKKHRA